MLVFLVLTNGRKIDKDKCFSKHLRFIVKVAPKNYSHFKSWVVYFENYDHIRKNYTNFVIGYDNVGQSD